MQMNNVVAIIVTYEPNLESLINNIISIKKQVLRVIVVANKSKNMGYLDIVRNLNTDRRIEIVINHNNLGIAAALNTGCNIAIKKYNPEWIITLDQDTKLSSNAIKEVLESYSVNKIENVGILALSNYNISNKSPFVEVDRWMTSGNLIRTSILNLIRFREDFFIDQVDYEFCFNVKRHGLKILVYCKKLIVQHQIGRKKILKSGQIIYFEPPTRYYYIVRNSTRLFLERKISPYFYLKQIIVFTFKLMRVRKFPVVIRCLAFGLYDGIFNHMYNTRKIFFK